MLTKHAKKRAQQRGIPASVQNLLLSYGEENFNKHGVIIRYFSSRSIQKMEQDVGRETIRRLSEYMRCYLLESISDGAVITMGKRHRNARIFRH
ncbi:MAG: hypothetical protein PHW66_03755 [Gallionella sp.]|nr:hypothetical protein [Gallionella sp.]